MAEDPRSQALHALSQFLVSGQSMGDTLHRVAEITTDALPSATMAGISILDHRGRAKTAIFTDEAAPQIDTSQYESGRGPCLDAWRTKRAVRIDDMAQASSDYPEFSKAAQEHGMQSSLSLPLVADDAGLGALNLYAPAPQGFSGDDESLGGELAAAAAIVLANATAYWDARNLGEQLNEAMKSRAEIEQAKGILMAQSPGIDADDAFYLLRRASQRENVKLRDVAKRIVERRSLAADSA